MHPNWYLWKPRSGKLFWCSFCLQMGIEVQKSALLTLFHFAGARATPQPHVKTYYSLHSFFFQNQCYPPKNPFILAMYKTTSMKKSKNPSCHLCIFRKPKYFFASMSSRHCVVPHDFILDQYHSTVHMITILHSPCSGVRLRCYNISKLLSKLAISKSLK